MDGCLLGVQHHCQVFRSLLSFALFRHFGGILD